jgi:hypothetical protein
MVVDSSGNDDPTIHLGFREKLCTGRCYLKESVAGRRDHGGARARHKAMCLEFGAIAAAKDEVRSLAGLKHPGHHINQEAQMAVHR